MSFLQMAVVSVVVSALVFVFVNDIVGYPVTYFQSFAGVITLKAVALFLAPEKAPMVLVRETKQEGAE